MANLILCRVYIRIHVAGHKLYPLVAVNMFLVSATKLSPVCRPSVAGYKWIQVDRDIKESPRYTQHVSRSNMYPYMYPDASCSSGIHVSGRHVTWCKRGVMLSVLLTVERHVSRGVCVTSVLTYLPTSRRSAPMSW